MRSISAVQRPAVQPRGPRREDRTTWRAETQRSAPAATAELDGGHLRLLNSVPAVRNLPKRRREPDESRKDECGPDEMRANSLIRAVKTTKEEVEQQGWGHACEDYREQKNRSYVHDLSPRIPDLPDEPDEPRRREPEEQTASRECA